MRISTLRLSISTLFIFLSLKAYCQTGLQVKFGDRGLKQLTYNGFSFIPSSSTGPSLTVEQYKASDRKGKVIYDWSKLIRDNTDIDKGIYSGTYNWGSLTCRYTPSKDTLKISVKITNTSITDTLYGVNIFPLHLDFQKRPVGWQPLYAYFKNNMGSPTIIGADLTSAKMFLCNDDVTSPLFVGMVDEQSTSGARYKVWVSAIATTNISALAPSIEKKMSPGQSIEYHVSLRFTSAKDDGLAVVDDILKKFRTVYPYSVKWQDRRPIGSLFLSSFENKTNKNNPRGWLPYTKVDVVSDKGREDFYKETMKYADRSVSILKSMNAQGMIIWDIEGQEFPHALSYIGSPEKLEEVAPEMRNVADDFFKKFKDAGLKTGLCIRPDSVVLSSDKKRLVRIPGDQYRSIVKKITYARKRWGCTLFYIDSNGDPNFPSDASIFKRINAQFPDVLLVPEHQNAGYYACSAPYEEWRDASNGIDPIVKKIYQQAFSVINVANWIPNAKESLTVSQQKLNKSVAEGNILMFRGWYQDDPVNKMVREAYRSFN